MIERIGFIFVTAAKMLLERRGYVVTVIKHADMDAILAVHKSVLIGAIAALKELYKKPRHGIEDSKWVM